MRNQIWWPSRTFRKENLTEKSFEDEEMSAINSLGQNKKDKEDFCSINLSKSSEKEHETTHSGWSFKIGNPPAMDNCCTDEYVNF